MADDDPEPYAERAGAPRDSTTEHLRQVLSEAAEDDSDRVSQQRNAGLAIFLLAAVVGLLLLAIVSGATDAFQP